MTNKNFMNLFFKEQEKIREELISKIIKEARVTSEIKKNSKYYEDILHFEIVDITSKSCRCVASNFSIQIYFSTNVNMVHHTVELSPLQRLNSFSDELSTVPECIKLMKKQLDTAEKIIESTQNNLDSIQNEFKTLFLKKEF